MAEFTHELPMFEIHGPDGHVWKIYENGNVIGFPTGVVVVNRATVKINRLLGCLKTKRS